MVAASLRHRLPERNPASNLILCMLRFGAASRQLLRNEENSKTNERFCETVVKFWVLVSSLKGLLGAQKQYLEIADSRGDLLKHE